MSQMPSAHCNPAVQPFGETSKHSIVDGAMVQEITNDVDLETIVATCKKSDEQTGWPSPFNEGTIFPEEWPQEPLFVAAALASLAEQNAVHFENCAESAAS
jgi:hypothetical protein